MTVSASYIVSTYLDEATANANGPTIKQETFEVADVASLVTSVGAQLYADALARPEFEGAEVLP